MRFAGQKMFEYKFEFDYLADTSVLESFLTGRTALYFQPLPNVYQCVSTTPNREVTK